VNRNLPAGIIAALLLCGVGCGGRHATAGGTSSPSPPAAGGASGSGSSTRGTTPPRPIEPGPVPYPAPPAGAALRRIDEGYASWYGVPYHGRQASNGEIYDMETMTAAHRTLPFNTIVRVTNLQNGKYCDVRIIDRGPFVEGRVIDLSLAAARAIDMVAAGLARVRLEYVNGPIVNASFTVQVGAFQQYDNALNLRKQLERNYQPVFIFDYDSPKGKFYRVRVGRVPSEQAAQNLARKLSDKENLTQTFVVSLDEPR